MLTAVSLKHIRSPDPIKRQEAWEDFYQKTRIGLYGGLAQRAPWLSRHESVSLVDEAYLAAFNFEPKGENFDALMMVRSFARRRAYSVRRKQTAKKRKPAKEILYLDTVSPAPGTDAEIDPVYPEPWLPIEISHLVSDYPRLQKLVAMEMIDCPDCTAGEIADAIAPALGKKPSENSVHNARSIVRKKLLPKIKAFQWELKRR